MQSNPTTSNSRLLMFVTAPVVLLFVLVLGLRFIPSPEPSDDIPMKPAKPTVSVRSELERLYPPKKFVPASSQEQKDLESVIRAQTDALKKGDYQQAHRFTIKAYRGQWSIDLFQNAIQNHYQPLVQAKALIFGAGQVAEKSGRLPVTVLQNDGKKVVYHFLLENTQQGWRIGDLFTDRPGTAEPPHPQHSAGKPSHL